MISGKTLSDNDKEGSREVSLRTSGLIQKTHAIRSGDVRRARVAAWSASDEGSGTIVGIALVMLCGVLLTLIATVGNLMVNQSRARAAADLTALSAAMVIWRSQNDACAVAQTIAGEHGGQLQYCRIDGEDVAVQVVIPTRVPFVPQLSGTAKAGPEQCP